MDFSGIVIQEQPTVDSEVPRVEPVPQNEVEEPPSTHVSVPLTGSSPIHIDLDIEDDEEIAAVPPEEVSKDTTVSWLENSLGRVRRRPSY